ncbi:MAG: DUF3300 domain-containing protein, partial [Candidatus Acidiferrum sp.]
MRRTRLVLLCVLAFGTSVAGLQAASAARPGISALALQDPSQNPPPPDANQQYPSQDPNQQDPNQYPQQQDQGPYNDQGQYNDQGTPPAYQNFSPEQLDNLLSPIALYPDPLLAQVFVAATFPDQVEEAARYVRGNGQNGVDDQNWDVSVKAVAHYPTVIEMMADKIDWTTSLGQAYVNQSTDVSSSVQRLRHMARNAGNLQTTPQQEVLVNNDYIAIDPVQPQYIYVPVYDPAICYYRRPYWGPAITFGVGFPIGSWLNLDFRWGYGGGYGGVFYTGWHPWGGWNGGWLARSRPVVRVNNYYINNRYTNITINHTVINRTVNVTNINRYNSIHRNVTYNNVRVNNVRANRVNNVRVNNVNGRNGNFQNNRPNNNVNNKMLNRNIDQNNSRYNDFRGHTNSGFQQNGNNRPGGAGGQQQNRPGVAPGQQNRPAPNQNFNQNRPQPNQNSTQPRPQPNQGFQNRPGGTPAQPNRPNPTPAPQQQNRASYSGRPQTQHAFG